MADDPSKTPETRTRARGEESPQKQRVGEATDQFLDDRRETAQLKSLQAAADDGPQAREAARLQAMVGDASGMRTELSGRNDTPQERGPTAWRLGARAG